MLFRSSNVLHSKRLIMTLNGKTRALAAALLALGSNFTLSPAWADIKDYEFQLVNAAPKTGEAVIAVQLINKTTGKYVPDAVIVATRIDMAPDGMETMTARIEAMPSSEPGVYLFKTRLAMVGGWRLSLAAKVQGETGTVQSRLTLKAAQ